VLESLELTLPDEVFEPRPPEHFVYWGSMSGSGDARAQQETSFLVWRGPFDAFLRAAASERGVRVVEATVSRVRPNEEGHTLDYGDGETLACRFVVDASGRAGVMAKAHRQQVEALRTLALTGHFETQEPSPPTIVETFADGWVWSAPLQNGLRDVTVMIDGDAVRDQDTDATYEAAIDRAPHLRSMLESAPRVEPIRGIDATPYSASRFCGHDFLLVGDAASFLDPLSAHGVHKAMDGALVATAVARTILERPSRALDAVRFYDERERDIFDITRARLARLCIFRRRLETHVDTLLGAIEWASSETLDLLNLSLGCTEEGRAPEFVAACARAREVGLVIVAAQESSGEPSLPGRLDGVIAVEGNHELEADAIRYENGVFAASSWARELPGLPKERNVHGVSLAVAHVTGMAAALLAESVAKSELADRLRRGGG
jgi:flavin-dependent dehydrogenase